MDFQAMPNAQTNKTAVFILLLFLTGLSNVFAAVNNDCQESCESFDVLRELEKIPKTDSSKDSVIAKYCLYSNAQKDSVWELLLYEQVIPLSIKIQRECRRSFSISGKFSLEVDKIFSSNLSGGKSGACIKTCIGSKETCEKRGNECKIDVDEKYNVYDYIDTFSVNSCLKGMEKASHLFNKYLPIKWDLSISCYDERIPISESRRIYISEICNEEQLKKLMNTKSEKKILYRASYTKMIYITINMQEKWNL